MRFTYSTRGSLGALQRGWVPKPGRAPSGVRPGNLPILITTPWPIRSLINKGCLQNISSNLKKAKSTTKYVKIFLSPCWKGKSCQNTPEYYLLLSQNKQVVWNSWKRCSCITTCLNSEYLFAKKVNSLLRLASVM